MNIVLTGAYGMGNLGDEAICRTLCSDILALNPEIELTIFCFNKEIFLKTHKDYFKMESRVFVLEFPFLFFSVKGIFRKIYYFFTAIRALCYADIVFLGGGGLVRNRTDWLKKYILPLKLAKILNKKIATVCIGVDVITNKEVVSLLKVLQHAALISVRDDYSRMNFADLGIESQVIADPVFHYPWRQKTDTIIERNLTTKTLRVGLNLSYWKADYSDELGISAFIESLGQVLNILGSQYSVTLIHMPTVVRKDLDMFCRLCRNLSANIKFEERLTFRIEEYLECISKCDIFIGMRLHSIILASCTDKPILGIAYDEKVLTLKDVPGLHLITIVEVTSSPKSVSDFLFELVEKRTLADWSARRKSSLKISNCLRAMCSE